MNALTPYQAKYLAYELIRRFPSGSSEKFNQSLMDAHVDSYPPQVEAIWKVVLIEKEFGKRMFENI